MAWLSGPFAFCSVTELLPWPESGAAAARARRAQFAARAGSLPARPDPDPGQPGSTLRYESQRESRNSERLRGWFQRFQGR